MFNMFKRPKVDTAAYDERLNKAIDEAKFDFEKAKMSEVALFESDNDPRLIKAETAKARQKYFFLLRVARQRDMKGHWSTAFVHPEV